MTLYDFFKSASVDDLAEFLAGFGTKLVFASIGEQIDEKELKKTECYKQLYEEYKEVLHKEIYFLIL